MPHFSNDGRWIEYHSSRTGRYESESRWLITDKLRSYGVAHRSVLPSAEHLTARYANNRAQAAALTGS